jgi:hypothetical protein
LTVKKRRKVKKVSEIWAFYGTYWNNLNIGYAKYGYSGPDGEHYSLRNAQSSRYGAARNIAFGSRVPKNTCLTIETDG